MTFDDTNLAMLWLRLGVVTHNDDIAVVTIGFSPCLIVLWPRLGDVVIAAPPLSVDDLIMI